MSTEPTPADYRALLAEVYDLAGRSRRRSEGEAEAHGTTAARWLVMSAISEHDLTAATIARRLGLPRQAVHRVVDDLVAQEQVRKRMNPDHARSELLTLTPSGRALVLTLQRASDPHRLALLQTARLTREDIDAARAVVRRLLDAFQDVDP